MKVFTRLLTRYWGYLAVVIAVAGCLLHDLKLAVILALSLTALGYPPHRPVAITRLAVLIYGQRPLLR